MVLIGDGTARINPIHGADLARTVVDSLLGHEPEVAVGGPDTYSWNEIAALAFDALGREGAHRVIRSRSTALQKWRNEI